MFVADFNLLSQFYCVKISSQRYVCSYINTLKYYGKIQLFKGQKIFINRG